MSFQNKGLWMAKGTECLTDNEMGYDNSARIEPKRSHQWFMDGVEADLFPNKRQTVEVPSNNFFPGMANANVSPWGNPSSFHSVPTQFTERLFDSETVRNINFDERNIPSVSTGNMNINMNMGSKLVEDPFGIDSSFGLSMSHTLTDPRSGLNYGGIRKVKVSQVKESENVMSVSMGNAYAREDNDTVSGAHTYNKADENAISMALNYNRGDEHVISMGETYNRGESNFISMGQPFNKGDDSISVGQHYSRGDDNISMGHNYRGNNSTISIGQAFRKGDNSVMSMGPTYNKGDDNVISMGQATHTFNKGGEKTVSLSHTYNKGDSNCLSIGNSFSKAESNIISFGGFHDDVETNPPGRLICSYDLLMGQASVQRSEVLNEKELSELNADALASATQVTASGTETLLKKKDEPKASKKVPSNNFPSNVRSLLSTGMLDGVSVKYIAWSREELRGVIKGSGYLCGCQACNFNKVINAYEFERHAGCKTKHPNNHIYFENGKTIYGIVQELRSTPQNLLFEVIQTITGSPINQKSFRLWKESFLAATRELQRIYGKDEAKQLS
ncbi:uncharacterized protein LOC131160331 isoform X2 [Malania oleifera]|uniref:uncharacterized protein LOC131160331 isoform X2 n=1 Tax=Malania oleifera TaxID=397392 RepID=UPI0025ADC917|nr:uncharacterized protein LOC131160331 isoform X2 [Malania oleifera]XP_057971901.1 uncharacterized protein LOC131160331 isoform X2 [Malania oleifera]XP_057971902.1 uncharacterized protein LOC131160331 isoform X2 [Malania oleifera]